jgi:hypothetical protein
VRGRRRLAILAAVVALVLLAACGGGNGSNTHTSAADGGCAFRDDSVTARRPQVSVRPPGRGAHEVQGRENVACGTLVKATGGGRAALQLGDVAACELSQDEPGVKDAVARTRDPAAALLHMQEGSVACTVKEGGTSQFMPFCGLGVLLANGWQGRAICDPEPVFRAAVFRGSITVTDPAREHTTITEGQELVYDFQTGSSSIGVASFTPEEVALFEEQARLLGIKFGTATPSTPATPVITTTELPPGPLLQPYSVPLAATGGQVPYAWSAVDLPPGLQLDPETGELSGAPTEQGTFAFTVQLQDAAGATASASLSLTVGPPPPLTVTTQHLEEARPKFPYSATLAATGGVPPYAWSVAEGSAPLPPGLELDATTGVIGGEPADNGEFSFTAQVTDSTGATATQDLTLVVTTGSPPVVD